MTKALLRHGGALGTDLDHTVLPGIRFLLPEGHRSLLVPGVFWLKDSVREFRQGLVGVACEF
jgi:hypothetical protein